MRIGFARCGRIVFACCVFVTSTSAVSAPRDIASGSSDGQWSQAQVREGDVNIASKAALLEYMSRNSDSPLNKLPPLVLQNFIDSLVFTPKGLGSYSYLGLSPHLTAYEIARVLSLFGAQETVANIPTLQFAPARQGLAVSPMSDVCEDPNSPMCEAGGGKTKTDYVCSNDGGDTYSCNYSFGDICASSCGK